MREGDCKNEDRCGWSCLGVLHVGRTKTSICLSVDQRPFNDVRVHIADPEASESKIRQSSEGAGTDKSLHLHQRLEIRLWKWGRWILLIVLKFEYYNSLFLWLKLIKYWESLAYGERDVNLAGWD